MSWEIALGIFALVGFVISIATIVGKWSGVVAELKATLQALNKTLEELKENNRASHKDIYEKISDHELRVAELETKINIFHGK